MRRTAQSRPPWPLIHSSCWFSRKRVASAGVLYVWFLRELSIAVGSEKNSGRAAARVDPLGALDRGRGEHADPQAAVGGEGLLRGEVVDVRLGDVDREAARAGGGVHQDQRALVGAGDALDRHGDAGGGLVVGEGVHVDARRGDRLRVRARVGGDDVRVGQPRGELGGLGELGAELAEAEVLRLVLDQAVGRDVPERGGPAVAEDDLVAVGELEQLADALTHLADQVLHRRLAVGGAQQGRAGRGQRVQRFRPHLGGTRTETTVGGLDVSRNPDLSHERSLAAGGNTGAISSVR